MPALDLSGRASQNADSQSVRDTVPPQLATQRRTFVVLRIILGLLLLTAAALKAHALFIGPSTLDSLLFSPRLQIATIQVEIMLGLWLLSGWSQFACWMAALSFFGIMAGMSLYLALVGQSSCGCFGYIAVSPWLTFTLDVAAVGALVACRPAQDIHIGAWLSSLLKVAVGAALFGALLGGVFLLTVDNPVETLSRLRGDSLTVEPNISQIGDGIAGEQRPFTIRLLNNTDRYVRVIGGTATCGCIATDDLPLTLAPGGSNSISVRVKFSGSPGLFRHRFLLYTDYTDQRTIIARFGGRVVESR